MKYLSEITGKTYDTAEACAAAEKLANAKNTERKEAAALVDEKFKAMNAAKKEYYNALNDFCRKYGTYHKTISEKDLKDSDNSLVKLFCDLLEW